MHGVHGLAGEPQCVHLATRVAGTGRGAAGGAEEEEESGAAAMAVFNTLDAMAPTRVFSDKASSN